MSQNQRVLNHLIDHGFITDLIARNYGIRRLASRIHDLKKFGSCRIGVSTREDDAGVRYAYYYMTDDWRNFERGARDTGYDYKGNAVKVAA